MGGRELYRTDQYRRSYGSLRDVYGNTIKRITGMKTREIMMIVFLSLAALLFSCSKEDPSVDPPDNQEEESDKNRTLEITIISDLSGRNTFPQDGLTDVASAVKENKSHLLLL